MMSCCMQQADITYDAQTFLSNWFNYHAAAANALGKPLLLEEFGKAVNVSPSVQLQFSVTPVLCRLLPFCCALLDSHACCH